MGALPITVTMETQKGIPFNILNKDEGKCFFCDEDRWLDRCHLIPRRFTRDLRGDHDCLHDVLLMCPTHHRLFDNHKMNETEKSKIKPYVDMSVQFLNIFLEHVEAVVDYDKTETTKRYLREVQKRKDKAEAELYENRKRIKKFIDKVVLTYNI